MYNLVEQFENKKGLFVFGDPAGAKACLSICSRLNNNLNLIISNRIYPFFENFNVNVENSTSKTISEWFEDHQPDYVFTGTSIPDKNELRFLQEAQTRNIKSFSFVDHWININERFKLNESYVYPSQVYLIDEEAKSIAIKEGLPSELIRIVGNPYYTFLENWTPFFTKSELFSKLGISKDSHYILFAPEPISSFNLQDKYGFDEVSGLNYLVKSLEELKFDNIKIIVKAHPNQNHIVFKEYIEKKECIYLEDFDINHLFYYSKVVIGYFSNSLIEASKMNCKIFRLLIDKKSTLIDPLLHQNIGQIINKKEQLLTELININNE
jgi:hypothetical protein